MPLFEDIDLTDTDYFRGIVLYGRNVASYKFALAESLFTIADQGKDFATLEELAIPFSNALCRHLEMEEKQSTRKTPVKFIEVLKSFNRGEISEDEKVNATRIDGFRYVIDAFHLVGSRDVQTRFFHDERISKNPGIRLTDALFNLTSGSESDDISKETESRWRLVETAWALNLPQRVVTVEYDEKLKSLFTIDEHQRRKSITNAAPTLHGYQQGKCFYCHRQTHIETWLLLEERAEVDHFFPYILWEKGDLGANLDQIWNLVLACNQCNGASEKRAQCPDLSLVYYLYQRNERLINSNLPIKETLMAQTGITEIDRKKFLQQCYNEAKQSLINTWKPDRTSPGG